MSSLAEQPISQAAGEYDPPAQLEGEECLGELRGITGLMLDHLIARTPGSATTLASVKDVLQRTRSLSEIRSARERLTDELGRLGGEKPRTPSDAAEKAADSVTGLPWGLEAEAAIERAC